MADLNVVVLSGRLTRDPETRTSKSGKDFTSGSIAVNRAWGDTNTVAFIDLVAFGYTSGDFAQLRKGDYVLVHGEISVRTWETEQGKRKATSIVISAIARARAAKSSKGGDAEESRPLDNPGSQQGDGSDAMYDASDGNAAPQDDDLPF